jgi:hypothetical protein
MADNIASLWSKGVDLSEPSPLSVLQAQIAPVKEMTKGLVEAETLTWSGNDGFVYHLYNLIAPRLGPSRNCIVCVSHQTGRLYPARVQSEALRKPGATRASFPDVGAEPSGAWSIHFSRDRDADSEWPQVKNSQELASLLAKVFQSEGVATLIQTWAARTLRPAKS